MVTGTQAWLERLEVNAEREEILVLAVQMPSELR